MLRMGRLPRRSRLAPIRDLLRLCGFKGSGPRVESAHEALFSYIMKGRNNLDVLPGLVDAAEAAHGTRSVREWDALIRENHSLSWEMLPSEALAEADVWRSLITNGNLPVGALLRNLGRLTKLGVLAPMDSFTTGVALTLTNQERVTKARVHPINVLIALRTYAQGHGERGKSSWNPVSTVIDALDDMFYLAFGNIEPANKRTLLAVDVSGSMDGGWSFPSAVCGLTPREIAAAMALATMKTEPQHQVVAFSHELVTPSVSARQRLDDVVAAMRRIPMGGTDCALPMIWATQHRLAVDTFQVYTDNETWAGRMHPHEALNQYRRTSGINARLQVIGCTATDFTIADPKDPGSLDVAGFDAAVPSLLANHSRGDL